MAWTNSFEGESTRFPGRSSPARMIFWRLQQRCRKKRSPDGSSRFGGTENCCRWGPRHSRSLSVRAGPPCYRRHGWVSSSAWSDSGSKMNLSTLPDVSRHGHDHGHLHGPTVRSEAVAAPSAGNASGAVAAYAARAGMEAYLFMPRDTPKTKIDGCVPWASRDARRRLITDPEKSQQTEGAGRLV